MKWERGLTFDIGLFIVLFLAVMPNSRVQAFDKPMDWFPPALLTYPLVIGEPLSVIPRYFGNQGIPDVIVFTSTGAPKTFFDLPAEDSAVRFYLLRGEPEGWGEPLFVGQLSIPNRQVISGIASPGVDLDSDGVLDVVAILTVFRGSFAQLDLDETETYMVILWGYPDYIGFEAKFMPLETGLIPPTSVVAGDFNSDGLVDLAFTDPQRLALQVLYNLGGRRWSEPYHVGLADGDNDCLPIPIGCVCGRFSGGKGQDLAVLAICAKGEKFRQMLAFLNLQDDQRWKRSPLFPLGPELFENIQDAFGALIVGDYDGDECNDLLFTAKLKLEGTPFMQRLNLMAIYMLPCPSWKKVDNPRLISAMPSGHLIFVENDLSFGWRIVSLRDEGSHIDVLHIFNDGRHLNAALSVPGYIAGAWVVARGERREIIVVSSQDLQSGITLFNVITRRSR
ncbi:MAG: hypothetical protein ABDI20_06800 [Candidatus Bipolaricaulaceae bacterium]